VRILDPIFQREINQLSSTHVLTMAVQLDIQGAPVPFRLVNYDQNIAFHGLNFEPFPLQVDSLEDAVAGSLLHLRVIVQNVTQDLISLLENYWAPVADPQWAVTIWQLDALQPDATAFGSGEVFAVSSVATNLLTAQFDMIAEGVTLSRSVPGRRYTTSSGYPFIPRR
jgi:hypothetical protein